MIKLVPIDSVQASAYNPRKNDEKRLTLTSLSLRKLGFLLPIFADENGEILSGHQRQLVARRLGFTMIPVEFVSGKDLSKLAREAFEHRLGIKLPKGADEA